MAGRGGRHRTYDVTLKLDDGTTTTIRTGANTQSSAARYARGEYDYEHPGPAHPRITGVEHIAYVKEDEVG